ncbi:hypothetical protein SAMN05444278_106104 [Psychroflexus salarius]|uniref:Uncharacterized protein n=1 Tax=Psychroflexus salarius TaxID=1155689 RepID=A0A1M4WPU6_9FLAO|nr:hypothetical protein [Psychroflexus salarius]SHE83259.1 hypothetical protein SAMN05444278_106104 [Psychroflexus salarius]
MGFFSWMTQDTNKSIANCYSGSAFTVFMLDDKGNIWEESNYNGYGMFGGKDFYELLAEMNGQTDREDGIKLYFDNDESSVKYPNLVEYIDNWQWQNKKPDECPHQGHFYE